MSPIVAEIEPVENQINSFFHNHKLGELLRQSNIRKDKGVSLDTLFPFLLTIAFTGKNLFRLLVDGSVRTALAGHTIIRVIDATTRWDGSPRPLMPKVPRLPLAMTASRIGSAGLPILSAKRPVIHTTSVAT